MLKKIFFTCIGFVLMHHAIAQNDDCKAPSYLNGFEGFKMASCQYSEFNEYKFIFNDLKGKYTEQIHAGKYYRINYERLDDGGREISGVQIRQNYFNAVAASKGENLSADKNMFRFRYENRIIWMLIENAWDNNDQGYQVYIIEEASLEQEIKLNIQESMKAEGKVALYGIYFDVDKSVIKPESEQELKTLTDYLKANPAVTVFVVGHTDNTGDFAHNLALSKARAKAVVDYLILKGIDAKRLLSDGVGPLCPLTTNTTDAGKKKNRRVEVVLR
ncbi:MAG: OmpA family protein [Bacteroidia bacterium]|nr:OmpA family protein [Bacteroidia bacterium]